MTWQQWTLAVLTFALFGSAVNQPDISTRSRFMLFLMAGGVLALIANA